MTRVILIRHSQTDYNLENRYCGFKDIGLNKIGRAQTRRIEAKLKDLKIDKIFCSDLKRSYQTAKIIFGEKSCPIVKRKNLREINFGRWEGFNFKQILKKYPSVYKKWLKDPFSVDIPAGEKMKHFMTRIEREIKNIIKNNRNKTIAVVGHYGPMRIILNNSFGIKKRDFWKIELEPKAIYIVEYK